LNSERYAWVTSSLIRKALYRAGFVRKTLYCTRTHETSTVSAQLLRESNTRRSYTMSSPDLESFSCR
jgi:hypothetical protein